MIKQTVNEYRFMQVLREDEYASWSYGATKALYDYYEQLSEDIGEDIELDHVAIRCEWNEYDTAWDAMLQYQPDDMPTVENSEGMDLVEIQQASEILARKWLEERTTVLDVDNTEYEYTPKSTIEKTVTSILVAQL